MKSGVHIGATASAGIRVGISVGVNATRREYTERPGRFINRAEFLGSTDNKQWGEAIVSRLGRG